MLVADREALQAELEVKALKINEQLLDFLNRNLNTLSTQAALVAGFSLVGLSVPTGSNRVNFGEWSEYVYNLLCITSFILELLVVIQATLLSVHGPKLAILGPEGSYQISVNLLLSEQTRLFKFFFGGIASFMLAAAFLGFFAYGSDALMGICCFVVVIALLVLVKEGLRTYAAFDIEGTSEQLLSTGAISYMQGNLNLRSSGFSSQAPPVLGVESPSKKSKKGGSTFEDAAVSVGSNEGQTPSIKHTSCARVGDIPSFDAICAEVENGVDFGRRREGFTYFDTAASGADIVGFLSEQNWCGSILKANGIGTELLQTGYLQHVKNEHGFKDDKKRLYILTGLHNGGNEASSHFVPNTSPSQARGKEEHL